MSDIYIEDYTSKSFVVRGDTRSYKEQLKSLGGKWNSGLTDKQIEEKFGGWIFWISKRQEVEEFVKNPQSSPQESKVSPKVSSQNSYTQSSLRDLEKRVEYLEDIIKRLTSQEKQSNSDYIEDEDEEKPRPRLLRRNK